jgi:hypothetical protein
MRDSMRSTSVRRSWSYTIAAAVIPALFAAGGCASLAHHTGWNATTLIEVVSDPPGAQVTVGGKVVGLTPGLIVLKRQQAHATVHVEKDGYEPADVALKRTVSGWIALDMALALYAVHPNGFADNPESRGQKVGIAVGLTTAALIIDFANGAAYNLPPRVQVTLKPVRKPPW